MDTVDAGVVVATGNGQRSDVFVPKVGLADWGSECGQPDKPDLFECREDYYHFPCGVCNHREEDPEFRCLGCRHYYP